MFSMIYPYLILAVILLVPITGIVLLATRKAVNLGRILIALTVLYLSVYGGFIALLILGLMSKYVNFYAVVIFILVVLINLSVIGALWGFVRKKAVFLPVIILAAVCILSIVGVESYNCYIESIPGIKEDGSLLWKYAPYEEGTKVAELGKEASLKLTEDLPKLDGATALYPVYSAFAKAVYPQESIERISGEYLACTKTNNAYYNIVTGDADIIFVAGPSKEQEQFAEENGVELIYTPIGKEGFVFFVNSKNPLENISVPEIQNIYSGKTTKWSELDVEGLGKIKAFQRPEGSGSQSGLQRLMGDVPIMTPPTEDVVGGMGGIIEKTADYKNFKNAIGYSYRFYSTEMVKNNQIRLLSIDGVYPSEENIRNNTYPIASNFYAVTRSDASENTKKLLEWILSEEGQKLVELTGYTPLK